MIKQCKMCGSWFDEDTNICQSCGEKDIECYDENELIDKLNDYQFVLDNLMVVKEGDLVKVECVIAPQKKGEFTAAFIELCRQIDWTKRLSNEVYRVVDVETKEQLFVGTKAECEEYKKNHETFWKELVIKEWFAK